MINLLHVLTWAALVVACWFLISAWRLHHKVRQQLKELETPPVPPTNVRVVQPDGSEDPVELVYQGRGVDGIHSRVAVPTSPFLTPDDDAKGEAHPRDIGRRVMVVTPVAAVMAALDRDWPGWPDGRDGGTDAEGQSETPCTRSCSERSRPFVLTLVSTEGPIPEKRAGPVLLLVGPGHPVHRHPRRRPLPVPARGPRPSSPPQSSFVLRVRDGLRSSSVCLNLGLDTTVDRGGAAR